MSSPRSDVGNESQTAVAAFAAAAVRLPNGLGRRAHRPGGPVPMATAVRGYTTVLIVHSSSACVSLVFSPYQPTRGRDDNDDRVR